jgi:hypothetical protein
MRIIRSKIFGGTIYPQKRQPKQRVRLGFSERDEWKKPRAMYFLALDKIQFVAKEL